MKRNMEKDIVKIMSNLSSSSSTNGKLESLEIFPDFGKFEGCKITIFNNGKVFVDSYEYYPDFKRDVKEISELVNIIEQFLNAMKKYYNIQDNRNNISKLNGGVK